MSNDYDCIKALNSAVDSSRSMMMLMDKSPSRNPIKDVKGISMNEGCVYSGKAIANDTLCIPMGYGCKVYNNENGKSKIWSFYRMSSTGYVTWWNYVKKFMIIGNSFADKPNGWCFYLGKGQYTFGYFINGKLYKDITPFVTDVYEESKKYRQTVVGINGKSNALYFGRDISEQEPPLGFYFLEDGSAFIGKGNSIDNYNITGNFIKLGKHGNAECGLFANGELTKQISPTEYIKAYAPTVKEEFVSQLNQNLLKRADSGLYLIIDASTRYDLDMGPLLTLKAIPFERISVEQGSNDISFTANDWEYFFLYNEPGLVESLEPHARLQQLWKVTLDDFHNHYGYAFDPSVRDMQKKNIHLHNSLVGLPYSKVVNFDDKSVLYRLNNPSPSKWNVNNLDL